ncbi:phosphoribosylaminoimidazolecarboxamide formyltransferase [Archaeoglobus neptunius]|uniref:phosphoribosylaminoimidazolecarboxamide formyltransferase n=1 Tax=Archaeoglobus neptunius TaxID=2798580 RepID=UPI00192580DC|nr:phosphoribosylaminoimidazolecarboxamide formyltransferase [Archaeoglobus neptunius]
MKALVSSSVKEGLEQPVLELKRMGFEILATDGTADYLEERGVEVRRLSEITGIEEDAWVKTLHPRIYEMIFSGEIDVVVVIPYRFDERPCRENIDIGGISLIRAAAKAGIGVAYDLESFKRLIDFLKGKGDAPSADAFYFTSEYDRKIAEWLEGKERDEAP